MGLYGREPAELRIRGKYFWRAKNPDLARSGQGPGFRFNLFNGWMPEGGLAGALERPWTAPLYFADLRVPSGGVCQKLKAVFGEGLRIFEITVLEQAVIKEVDDKLLKDGILGIRLKDG